MANNKSLPAWGKFFRWFLPVCISVVGVFLVFRQVSFRELQLAFAQVPNSVVALMILIFLIGLILRTLSWKIVLGSNFSFRAAFFGINVGYLLNNILPFRLGEIGRGILLSGDGQDRGSFMEILGAILTERILDVILAAIFFLLALPLVAADASLKRLAWIALGVMLLLVLLAAWGSKNQVKVTNFFMQKFPNSSFVKKTLLPALNNLLRGFQVFLYPRRWLPAFLLLMFSWVFAMLELWVLQRTLIPAGQWWWPALVVSASSFINALPSAPAGIGVLEAGIVGAYALLNVDRSVSLAVALILHAIQFAIPSLLGLIGINVFGSNLGMLIQRAFQRRGES